MCSHESVPRGCEAVWLGPMQENQSTQDHTVTANMCDEWLPTVDHASRSRCPTLLHVHDPVRAELHSALCTDRSVRHASRCLPWGSSRCRRARRCVHSCHQTARYRTDCPSRPAMFLPALGGLPSFVCQYGARYCPNFIMGRRHRNSRWGSCAHVRCRFRAPTNVSAPIQSDQALQPLPTDGMLRKDVCWIAFAVDFPQVYAFGSHGLLNPKRMRVKMSEFTQTLTRAYADCRAGISPYAQRQFHPNVSKQ